MTLDFSVFCIAAVHAGDAGSNPTWSRGLHEIAKLLLKKLLKGHRHG